ncbi:MAG: phosphoenolpyruvate-utilizing N-terminal domain-containing protein, partial [Kiritimatiellia bacterium]
MKHTDSEIHIKGLPVSPGVAIGPVCLLNESRHTPATNATVAPAVLEHETRLLHAALRKVGGKLARLVIQVTERAGPAEAAIFSALKTMLDDAGLQQRLFDCITNLHSSAEMAVVTTFDQYAGRMQSVRNSFVRERAADIRDLKTHLLDALHESSPLFRCEGALHCHRGNERIV